MAPARSSPWHSDISALEQLDKELSGTTKENPMKYMLLVIGFHEHNPETGGGPTVEEFSAYEQSLVDAGVRVDGSALADVEIATTVQIRPDGERVVTNGPFAETREYLGGYDIIDVADLDAALDWAARCPGATYGRVEVRPLLEF